MFLLASGFGCDDDRSAAWRFHVYGPELLLFGVLWRLCQICSVFCRFILGYCLLLGLLIFGRDGILCFKGIRRRKRYTSALLG